MNILFYLFSKLTDFISIHQKKLSIFIPFLLGILFSLFYILHIHNYYFVFPKSALLYVLSCISFLTSILIVLKYVDSKTFKKIIMGVLLVCLAIFIVYLLSELKILEHKVLRFRLIKILTLILFVVNILIILFENEVISSSHKYVLNHKIEVLIYCVCLTPFVVYVGVIYPGSADMYDTVSSFLQATGIEIINDWYSVLVIFMFRVSLALHLSALSLLYIINILGIIYSAIIMSRLAKNLILKYLLLILTYMFPIIMHHFYLMPKDAMSTFFIIFASSMLIYSLFKQINYNFYLGIFCLLISSIVRHNQITQTIILLIPFAILYTYHKNLPVKYSLKVIILFLVIVFSLQKGIFANKRIIEHRTPEIWIYRSDIIYIIFDQKKLCEEYKSVFTDTNCKDYNQSLKKFNIIQNSPIELAHFIYSFAFSNKRIRNIDHPRLWLKYITNYPGSWLTFHYTTALQNFLHNKDYWKHLNYNNNMNFVFLKAKKNLANKKYNYTMGYIHFKRNSHIDKFIQKFSIRLQFKYKLYLIILVVITTFIINRFKFLPINMGNDCKYSLISYYLSLSCITLLIPLALLIPTGWEARYLAGVDFPFAVSIVMLLIYLYKELIKYDKKLHS